MLAKEWLWPSDDDDDDDDDNDDVIEGIAVVAMMFVAT